MASGHIGVQVLRAMGAARIIVVDLSDVLLALAGEDIQIPTVDLTITERNIIGNLVGTWARPNALMALADRGLVNLQTRSCTLLQANQALKDLHHGKIKGHAVLIP